MLLIVEVGVWRDCVEVVGVGDVVRGLFARELPGATTWVVENFWACGLHQALSMKRKKDERLK